MKDPRKVVLVSVIIVLALMFGVAFLKESFRNKNKKISPSISVSPTKVQNKYKDWNLFRNGYALLIPSDWKNSSDVGGTAILEPSDPLNNELKNINKISITVLSDKKATGQRFTTEKEFFEWSAVVGEVQGKIQKLDNLTVGGEKAIMLIDASGGDNEWKIIVWVRKDNINLYINFDGQGKYNKADAEVINYITSQFNFVAPPMTGKEGKN